MWAVGHPIGFGEALAAGSAALVVRVAGLTPNGLGLSEWVSAWLLSAGLQGQLEPGEAVAAGLMAGLLLDRAVEIVVALISGGVSAWGLRAATADQ
mgnify:CR=1 FL=1